MWILGRKLLFCLWNDGVGVDGDGGAGRDVMVVMEIVCNFTYSIFAFVT